MASRKQRQRKKERRASRRQESGAAPALAAEVATEEEAPEVDEPEGQRKVPKWAEGLNFRQQRFVQRYAKHGEAARAYREAGYESAQPAREASELRTIPKIAAAIETFKLRCAMRAEVSIAECLARYNLRAKANIKDFVEQDAAGRDRIRSLTGLPRHKTAAIKSLTVEETFTPDPKVKTKIELYGSKESDDAIMKHLGGFIERKELTGKDGGPIEVVDLSRYSDEDLMQLENILSKPNPDAGCSPGGEGEA